MNLKEAYSILELPQTATPEEAKKRYRELTKKYHPDVNKESGAEDKFKKINEAYQVVSSGKSTDQDNLYWQARNQNPFGGAVVVAENIDLHTTLSFKESVLGCKKEIKYTRKTKCRDCSGQGEIPQNNGCDKCGGIGQIRGQRGNMIFSQTCPKCYGKVPVSSCSTCNATGVVTGEASISVSVPGGVQTGNVLRIGGMGNFAGSFGPFEQHTDIHLHLTVTPEKGLRIDGNCVISELQISLLEALRGCNKTVKTIMGEKEVTIKPKTRNKDEIIIPSLGVNGTGDHKVVLDVYYPESVDRLIDALSNEG